MSEPQKTHLSPAFARSTFSPRRITSTVRGIDPAGISATFSWTRTRCQSTNFVPSVDDSSFHSFWLGHDAFLHLTGSEYLNCCSTGSERAPHNSHWKTATRSSGRTSDVRVTVPWNEMSFAILSVRRSRMHCCTGKLKKLTTKSLSSVAYSACSRRITSRRASRSVGSKW